jgi:hypothetical protein
MQSSSAMSCNISTDNALVVILREIANDEFKVLITLNP